MKSLMTWIGKHQLFAFGMPYLELVAPIVEKISPTQVSEMASSIISPKNLAVSVQLPLELEFLKQWEFFGSPVSISGQ
jgi:hypothetical protein